MHLPPSSQLNIASLSRLFDNKSECYKLFWFQALLRLVCAGQQEMTYEELINEMIADAWYMVTEFHLNLGPNDALEMVVNHISSVTEMHPSEKRDTILEWLAGSSDSVVKKYKRQLTLYVPYRIQAPFLGSIEEHIWQKGNSELASIINRHERLLYYFSEISGLKTRIHVDDMWMAYLTENQEILRGWIQYNMIIYLQRRNPSVPGISDKLSPPQERRLERVKKYWNLVTNLTEIHEIYGNELMSPKMISIDHFVHWSYVAHDEFWNFHPTTKSFNSNKSNNLPAWEQYFWKFADLEYKSYQMIWTYEKVRSEFESCAKEHLNNPEIRYRLYGEEGVSAVEFSGRLKDVLYPVWLSAKTCGFREWSIALLNDKIIRNNNRNCFREDEYVRQ